jgi:hypothetical protein
LKEKKMGVENEREERGRESGREREEEKIFWMRKGVSVES